MSAIEPFDENKELSSASPEASSDPLRSSAACEVQADERKPPVQRIFGTPADTKTSFDSLRNMGICIAMLLGLPTFYNATGFLSPVGQGISGCFVVASAITLAIANLAWTFQTLEDKSSWIAKAFLTLIGSGVIGAFAIDALKALPGI
ncbi:hypothetical protein QEM11_003853 [Pseudomonas putida]|nr:hypothetical protein [Pseudomonas putida]